MEQGKDKTSGSVGGRMKRDLGKVIGVEKGKMTMDKGKERTRVEKGDYQDGVQGKERIKIRWKGSAYREKKKQKRPRQKIDRIMEYEISTRRPPCMVEWMVGEQVENS